MKLSKVAALVVLVALPAIADDANFRPYLVGGRAAGMGGAFTALSDDGSGGYYNPGGLAFATRSSLSLSGSVYGVITGKYNNALGTGHDYSYKDLNIFPVSTAAVRKLGEPDPETGVGRDTLVFSVFVPDAIHNNDRDTIEGQENTFFLTQDSQTLWVGAGYARKFGRVGIGAMGYGLLGTAITQLDVSAVVPNQPSQFGVITFRSDQTTIGFLGAVGARMDATDHLRFGLSLFTPAVGFGSRSQYVRVAAGATGQQGAMAVSNHEDLEAKPTAPLRIQAGAAWEQGPWTLAGDLIFLGNRSVSYNPELAAQGLDEEIVRTPVFNVSVGGEYVLDQKYPLRAGFFTDLAGTHAPDELVGQPQPSNSTHLNRYGLSFSGGLKSEHVRTDVGLNLIYGYGQDLIPVNLDFSQDQFTDVHQFNVYVFLATSYEF